MKEKIEIDNFDEWSLIPENSEEINEDLPYAGIEKLFENARVVDTIEAKDVICKMCKRHPKVFIYPEERGAYEIYCDNCNAYLDEEGNFIE